MAAPVEADNLERLSRLVAGQAADVIELTWHLQQEQKCCSWRAGLAYYCCSGPTPRTCSDGPATQTPLFTPVPRVKTRSGFGRHGHGCREFRHLDRACGETLLLVDLPLEEAVQVVKECSAEIREEYDRAGRARRSCWLGRRLWQGSQRQAPRVKSHHRRDSSLPSGTSRPPASRRARCPASAPTRTRPDIRTSSRFMKSARPSARRT